MEPLSLAPLPRKRGQAGGQAGCRGAGSTPGGSLPTPHSHCHQTWGEEVGSRRIKKEGEIVSDIESIWNFNVCMEPVFF